MDREVLKKMILAIIPEFLPCIGFQQNNPYHIYDVFDHTIVALESCETSYDKVTILAVLFHDIGKPECYKEDEKGIGHFHGHAEISADLTNNLMKFIGFKDSLRIPVVELIKYHSVFFEENYSCIRSWYNKLGYLQFTRLLNVRRADVKAQTPDKMQERLDKIDRIEKMIIKIKEETTKEV